MPAYFHVKNLQKVYVVVPFLEFSPNPTPFVFQIGGQVYQIVHDSTSTLSTGTHDLQIINLRKSKSLETRLLRLIDCRKLSVLLSDLGFFLFITFIRL